MTVEERQEKRRALKEEMMALYRENDASPTGGCLPLLLQMPMFLILYGTIRGLTHVETIRTLAGATVCRADPLNLAASSKLYQHIVAAHGAMNAFGINLADSLRSPGLSLAGRVPYAVVIVVAVGLQLVQMRQLAGRNPAGSPANPQVQQMQKVQKCLPAVFAVIYLSIPAGVTVYFIVSSLFRIGQQELMYRRDPKIVASMHQLRRRLEGPEPA
jgi:YidC/Oxa1 family membrane protein insertase